MIVVAKRTSDFEDGYSWLKGKKLREYALSNWTNYSLCYSKDENKLGERTFICMIPESIEDRKNLFELENMHYL